MTRSLFCRRCGEGLIHKPLHDLDRAHGWKVRIVFVNVCVLPANHGVTVNGVLYPFEGTFCDSCNEPLTNTIAIARTMWQPKECDYPHDWEKEYGTIMLPEVVRAADKLTQDPK